MQEISSADCFFDFLKITYLLVYVFVYFVILGRDLFTKHWLS